MNKTIITAFVILFLAGMVYALTPQQEFDLKVFGTTGISQEEINDLQYNYNRIVWAYVLKEQEAIMWHDLYVANVNNSRKLMTFREWKAKASQGGGSQKVVEVEVEKIICTGEGYTSEDYLNVKYNLGRTDCESANGWCSGADLDKNGFVNSDDLNILAECLN